ncbi:hypothetical protein ACFFNY_05565 [Paenibacillus hodogayensis]|uniref:GNAT family N-acetyltransferase n=1 Tax=Paenibacillus hodogayensis TaxID=279208 RepID=A0ABV5VRX9_9BACL
MSGSGTVRHAKHDDLAVLEDLEDGSRRGFAQVTAARSVHRFWLGDVLPDASLEHTVNRERKQKQIPQHLYSLWLLQVDFIGLFGISQEGEVHLDMICPLYRPSSAVPSIVSPRYSGGKVVASTSGMPVGALPETVLRPVSL